MKPIKFDKITLIFCYLTAFALSIKNFREPDLWWQIRTGEWILQNHSIPRVDVFSYTMQGAEWINIKWGFEVLAAIVSKATGPESVYIIQAIVSILMVFFLYKLSKLPSFNSGKEFNPHVFFISIFFTLLAIEYRMIGRPEMFSHLFTLVFLYLLLSFRTSNSKQIFLLIPLQIIWANFHEAFGIGVVMIAIFTFSYFLKLFYRKKENQHDRKKKFLTLTTILITSILSICINPIGTKLLMRPFNIMSQVYNNKFTTELYPASYYLYWQKEAYIGLFILLVIVTGLYMLSRNTKSKNYFERIIEIGPGYLLTLIAFFYLAITAYRNIIFFVLVSFPLFYFVVRKIYDRLINKIQFVSRYSGQTIFLLIFTFYILVVSNGYYSIFNIRDRFGLEVSATKNPVDGANWIEANGLKSKKCLSDYLISSYLLWKLQPDFQTYIDLRDFDVYPPEFFNKFILTVNYADEFLKADSLEKFDYVVLLRSQFGFMHGYLYNDSIYACKYVDPVVAIYQKTDSFSKGDIFSDCKPVPVSGFSNVVNHILNPFYKKYDYHSFEQNYLAAEYYMSVHRFDLASERAQKIIANGQRKDAGYELLGTIKYQQAISLRDSLQMDEELDQANDGFSEALRSNKHNIKALAGIARVLFSHGSYNAALNKFEKCIEEDPEYYDAHIMAGECCKKLLNITSKNRNKLLDKMLKHFKSASSLNPGNPYLLYNVGYTYFTMNDCDHAEKYFKKVKDDENLDPENRRIALSCLQKCGVQ